MNKLKTFFKTFTRSLQDPKYYNDVLRAPFSFSLKYLFLLLFLILFVKGVVFAVSVAQVYPKIPGYISTAKEVVKDFYPSELTVTINNGSIRTNVDEPYVIPFPKQFNVKDMAFAVIDTKSPIDDAKKFKTVLFVNKNAIAYPDSESKGGYKVYFLNEQKGYMLLNREVYNRITSKITPYFDYAPHLLVGFSLLGLLFLPLFGSLFYLSGILFYLLILSVPLYFISKIMSKKLGFWNIYHLGMHGITFSLVFDAVKSIFNVIIPFTFAIPFLIWMILVFNSLTTHESNSPSHKSV